MRVDAKSPSSKWSSPLVPRPMWLVALAASGLLWGLLIVVQIVGLAPNPLLITVGASFSAWALSVGLWRRTRPWSLPRALLALCLPWGVTIAVLLGALYSIDRGGWLWFLVAGYDIYPVDKLTNQIDSAPADFVERHPAFVLDPQNAAHLRLPAGQHTFGETVVVPRGTRLTIEPGADVRLGPGRSLIAYSPIVARGTADAPIRFSARYGWLKWGVVGIVDTGPSVFEHVHFTDSRQARVNEIEFVAGLSIYDADVTIAHSRFEDAFGKDAVNVRRGHVRIQENLFHRSYKDGLDLDGGAGEVSRNQFIDCADEGIDLSENEQIAVFDNTILDRRGGRIGADLHLDEIRAANTLGYSSPQ